MTRKKTLNKDRVENRSEGNEIYFMPLSVVLLEWLGEGLWKLLLWPLMKGVEVGLVVILAVAVLIKALKPELIDEGGNTDHQD